MLIVFCALSPARLSDPKTLRGKTEALRKPLTGGLAASALEQSSFSASSLGRVSAYVDESARPPGPRSGACTQNSVLGPVADLPHVNRDVRVIRSGRDRERVPLEGRDRWYIQKEPLAGLVTERRLDEAQLECSLWMKEDTRQRRPAARAHLQASQWKVSSKKWFGSSGTEQDRPPHLTHNAFDEPSDPAPDGPGPRVVAEAFDWMTG